MSTPSMYVGPAGRGTAGSIPSEARRALQETLRSLDEARSAIMLALNQPVLDTCGIYIQRAGTQMGHARNNLLRASACLRAPEGLAPLMNFRSIPQPPAGMPGRRF